MKDYRIQAIETAIDAAVRLQGLDDVVMEMDNDQQDKAEKLAKLAEQMEKVGRKMLELMGQMGY